MDRVKNAGARQRDMNRGEQSPDEHDLDLRDPSAHQRVVVEVALHDDALQRDRPCAGQRIEWSPLSGLSGSVDDVKPTSTAAQNFRVGDGRDADQCTCAT
jgi:hypothetical protein